MGGVDGLGGDVEGLGGDVEGLRGDVRDLKGDVKPKFHQELRSSAPSDSTGMARDCRRSYNKGWRRELRRGNAEIQRVEIKTGKFNNKEYSVRRVVSLKLVHIIKKFKGEKYQDQRRELKGKCKKQNTKNGKLKNKENTAFEKTNRRVVSLKLVHIVCFLKCGIFFIFQLSIFSILFLHFPFSSLLWS